MQGIPFSYAIVNEAQMAAMREHGGFELAECDGALQQHDPAMTVAYRIKLPLRFDQIAHLKTFVFVTCEAGFSRENGAALARIVREFDVWIVTPSEFSRGILLRHDVIAEKVAVIPHGVDKHVMFPAPNDGIGRPAHQFTFLHVSTLEHRKGADALLKAFAQIAILHPDARLILKGCDQLNPSRRLAAHWMTTLSQTERRATDGKIAYIGDTLTRHQMADLYRSADCLVQPYRAESYCMPVVEALACGIPVLCTAGGPTDALIEGHVAFGIKSQAIPLGTDGQQMILEPDVAHLAALMVDMYEIPERRQRQAECAFKCLGWDDVAVQLHQLFSRHLSL